MKIYNLIINGNWCSFKSIENLMKDIKLAEVGEKMQIEVKEMTEKEYAELPEFQGF